MTGSSQLAINGIHYSTGRPVRVEVKNGLIINVTQSDYSEGGRRELYLAPGLIDNQINGYANVDFSGDDLTVSALIDAAGAIWKTGVTTFLPTLITNSHEKLLRNFRILSELLSADRIAGESVPGFHLEGPYISPDEGYRGCHPVNHIRKPSWDEFAEYQKASGGKIIQVTIAPETEGAIDFIRRCRESGVVVAIGHTKADAEIISHAVAAGATLSTHLGNGCANHIHRHYNPIWPQLANEQLIPTIIADGFHLLPEEIKVFLKVKGRDRIVLTSDVIYLAGMAPGKYTFLESEVELTADGMLRNTELKCLAGASFPLKSGIGNMMKFAGCSLGDAINMASLNVSHIYGLTDRGDITPGKRADLILFEKEGDDISIVNTYIGGKLVFKKN